MKHVVQCLARLVMLTVVTAFAAITLAPTDGGSSPYATALSNLAAGESAFAAPSCAKKHCFRTGKFRCSATKERLNCHVDSLGACHTTVC